MSLLLSHAQTLAHIFADEDDDPQFMTCFENAELYFYDSSKQGVVIDGCVPRPLIRLQHWFTKESQRSLWSLLSDGEQEANNRLLISIRHLMALLVWDYFPVEQARWHKVIPQHAYQVYLDPKDERPILVLVQVTL